MFYIIGLGNPGAEYKESRHNTGKMAVEYFKTRNPKSEIRNLRIIESNEFMNNSGRAVAKFIKNKKAAQNLIVVYDDIDLALGTIKISWNKSSGGHKGLESVIKAAKTKEFIRVRIGISPKSKPQGDKKVLNFILGKFTPKEKEVLKKSIKKAAEAIQTIIEEGRGRAMNRFN